MFPTRVGPQTLGDGAITQERGGRDGAIVGINGHGYYQEPVYRGNVYSLNLNATTTAVAAGNIVSAAAAASTQFALFNPANSGKLMVLLRFRMGIISGTPGPGPLFHGFILGVPTLAASGTILSNYCNAGSSSVGKAYTSAAGAALTGGLAPSTHIPTNFAATATAEAAPYFVTTDDLLDGQLIIPQNTGWLPLWSLAGTSLLNAYSITWEEIPV